ncbi:sugar transferase involved in lipopolysaccharide synthesis [Rubidibacter lacunae KORDI 51-2]|uniref:Sugar transferase involved in lipopolysaccharide synthesis n=1 Tax=Rubidibacter lacunae KORDI 51-2 TaxID=582515 RepID=U5DG64_9CHRO|nr:sugar transferase [Rubidibacter lacunae]ERN40257.1 sugar transferase involved in lipopolysaccharide synthesis [Rubidibacter lacunae KORDI 51-2]
MTAHSQLTSVKLRAALSRGWGLPFGQSQRRGFARPFVDGEAAKRLFDIVFSLAVLVLCLPLYLLLAAAIAIDSPGPIFYVQERIGKNRQYFGCIKFRTMVANADEVMEALMAESPELRQEFEENFKLRDDPRVTTVGKFLRYTSLDEFPQFWNVLRGDMSVVGPRPLVPEELYKYGRHIEKVLMIRPGITGLWQVSGRNNIPYERRVNMDVYYVNFRTWALDSWVVLKTVGVILFPQQSGGY